MALDAVGIEEQLHLAQAGAGQSDLQRASLQRLLDTSRNDAGPGDHGNIHRGSFAPDEAFGPGRDPPRGVDRGNDQPLDALTGSPEPGAIASAAVHAAAGSPAPPAPAEVRRGLAGAEPDFHRSPEAAVELHRARQDGAVPDAGPGSPQPGAAAAIRHFQPDSAGSPPDPNVPMLPISDAGDPSDGSAADAAQSPATISSNAEAAPVIGSTTAPTPAEPIVLAANESAAEIEAIPVSLESELSSAAPPTAAPGEPRATLGEAPTSSTPTTPSTPIASSPIQPPETVSISLPILAPAPTPDDVALPIIELASDEPAQTGDGPPVAGEDPVAEPDPSPPADTSQPDPTPPVAVGDPDPNPPADPAEPDPTPPVAVGAPEAEPDPSPPAEPLEPVAAAPREPIAAQDPVAQPGQPVVEPAVPAPVAPPIPVADSAQPLSLSTLPGQVTAQGDQLMRIDNPNATPVAVTWEVPGSNQGGQLTANPGATSFAVQGLDHGDVRLLAAGELQDTASFDLPNPQVSLSGAREVVEGDKGVSYVEYTVELDRPANRAVELAYEIGQAGTNTATLGEDVQAGGGRLTLAAGETTGRFRVAVYGDQAFEGDQSFKVTVTAVTPDVDIAVGEARTTIVEGNDDLALRSGIHVEFSQLYSPEIAWNDERLVKWQADGPREQWGVEQHYAGGKADVRYDDAATMTVDSNGWNVMKAVHVESAEAGSVTVKSYVYADVSLGVGDTAASTVRIEDVKRGHVSTGEGDDRITVTIDTNSSDAEYNTVDIGSGGGADQIQLTGDLSGGVNGQAKSGSILQVNAGEGEDRVAIGGGTYATSRLDGGAGDDALTGGSGKDTLLGGQGNDRMAGGAGIDTLTGGAGDDTLFGGGGNDAMRGEAGSDIFVFGLGGGRDTADGGQGWTDAIDLSGTSGWTQAAGDWTLTLQHGQIQQAEDGFLVLSADSAGTLRLADGSELVFQGIERIHG